MLEIKPSEKLTVGELKQMLDDMPDDASVLLTVFWHKDFVTKSGSAIAAHLVMGEESSHVFVLSSTPLEFDRLNYQKLKVLKRFS